ILGGSAGTTYDAFKLLSEAKKYGARVALFGRKINNAENQLAFIRFLRLIADGEITAEEAVRAYHGVLQKLGIKPHRDLAEDMQLQTGIMSYGGNGTVISLPQPSRAQEAKTAKEKDAASKATCACSSGAGSACPCKMAKPSQPTARKPIVEPLPDFSRMTAAEKVAYHRARWNRILG
ncbi:MAG: hypothetical protein NZM31_14335, partial [Gemmatales bacterium]|nr:hypothetical protein [Gemmatales bacterium]MDW8388174.1 hypothetical protein [Gemmatales bacterium]